MINQVAGEGVAISTFSYLLLGKYGSHFSLGLLVLGVASLGGSMIALRYVLSAVLSPIIGKMSDQSLGRSTVIIVGITAGIISFLIFGFAGSFRYILVGTPVRAVRRPGRNAGGPIPSRERRRDDRCIRYSR